MHTDMKRGEKRKHQALFTYTTKIGMHTPQGIAFGTAGSNDQGGWIYPVWNIRPKGAHLPGYLRSTQVFIINEE